MKGHFSVRYANSYCITLLDLASKASSVFGVGMHRLQILTISVWLRASGCQAVHMPSSARLKHISLILLSFTTIAGRAVSITISSGQPGNAGSVMSCFNWLLTRSYMQTLSIFTYRVHTCRDAARTTFTMWYFEGGVCCRLANGRIFTLLFSMHI